MILSMMGFYFAKPNSALLCCPWDNKAGFWWLIKSFWQRKTLHLVKDQIY
ncbi:hypothetical protein DsansV1_C14g0131681 [Dioscorea sansibarensis]